MQSFLILYMQLHAFFHRYQIHSTHGGLFCVFFFTKGQLDICFDRVNVEMLTLQSNLLRLQTFQVYCVLQLAPPTCAPHD